MASPTTDRQRGLRTARIAWNREAVGEVTRGMADGLAEVMAAIVADASEMAPRDAEAAAKRGVPMLKDTGRIAVYAGGVNKSGKAASLLVVGTAERTQARNKPRGAKTPLDQVVGFAMFDSPLAHLQELGTVNMEAHPFLSPAVARHVGDAGPYIAGAIQRYASAAPKRAVRSAEVAERRRVARAARKAGVSQGLMGAIMAEAAKR